MKFEELRTDSQDKAVRDYISGWRISHPRERMTNSDAWLILAGSDDNYDDHGRFQDEECDE